MTWARLNLNQILARRWKGNVRTRDEVKMVGKERRLSRFDQERIVKRENVRLCEDRPCQERWRSASLDEE